MVRLKGIHSVYANASTIMPGATKLTTGNFCLTHTFEFLLLRNNCYTIIKHTNKKILTKVRIFVGALEGIRTPDLRLRRALLYPTELQTHIK